MSWAEQELKSANLGDKRRNRRLITIVEDLAAQPNESVPTASRSTAAMQSMYEFWANPRIKASEILSAHTCSRDFQGIKYTICKNDNHFGGGGRERLPTATSPFPFCSKFSDDSIFGCA